MKFQGFLRPIVERLADGAKSKFGHLTAQSLFGVRGDIHAYMALDSDGLMHLLISPCPSNISKLTKVKLKSLKIQRNKWIVSGQPEDFYLDVRCSVSSKSPLSRPFLGFCEDILDGLDSPKTRPVDVVYRTGLKWKRFWSSDLSAFTGEWLRGLMGELLFLEGLVIQLGGNVLSSWTGPYKSDHDFKNGNVGCEIKTSCLIPMMIEINTLNQMDNVLFDHLYLVCYSLSVEDKGDHLCNIVRRIETHLDDEHLEIFSDLLYKAGYRRQREEEYSTQRYVVTNKVVCEIDEDFPKITRGSFRKPIDARVSHIKYSIEMTDIKRWVVDDVCMFGNLRS